MCNQIQFRPPSGDGRSNNTYNHCIFIRIDGSPGNSEQSIPSQRSQWTRRVLALLIRYLPTALGVVGYYLMTGGTPFG